MIESFHPSILSPPLASSLVEKLRNVMGTLVEFQFYFLVSPLLSAGP